MEVEYKGSDYKGKERIETQSVSAFLHSEILYHESYSGDRERIRLEDQPQQVLEAMGRLVERLLEKNVLNLDDLKHISGCNWGRKADSLALLALKKEE